MRNSHERGYVALMSIIVISMVLFVTALTLNLSSFFSRMDVLDGEFKRESLALAESCAHSALIMIAKDASFTPTAGGDCASVGDTCGAAGATHVCKICSVTRSGNDYTILTRAAFNTSYSAIEAAVEFDARNYRIHLWRELPTYKGAACPLS